MATISYGLKPLNSFICTSKAKGSCDLSLSTIYHKATKMTTNIDKSKKNSINLKTASKPLKPLPSHYKP